MAFAFCKLGANGEKARGIQRAFGVNVADKAGCTLGLKGKRIPNFARDAAVQKLFLYRFSGGIVSLTAIAGEDQDFHMASTFFPVRSVTGQLHPLLPRTVWGVLRSVPAQAGLPRKGAGGCNAGS